MMRPRRIHRALEKHLRPAVCAYPLRLAAGNPLLADPGRVQYPDPFKATVKAVTHQ